MVTREPKGTVSVAIAAPEITELPAKLFVVEGTLSVGTNDDSLALTAFRGLEYLVAREFMRQQPGLSLLYDLEFFVIKVRRGSKNFDFKIVAKLKRRIKNIYKKVTTAEIATVIMGTPAAIVGAYELHEKLFPPVEHCLRADLPHVQIEITNIVIRAPDGREKFLKEAKDFHF